MKKPRLRTVLIFSLAGLSGGLLLHTSQRVQQAEDEVRKLQASLEQERETIRVLKAEWAYLNAPQRLEFLAGEHLGLGPSGSNQIVSEPSIIPLQQQELFHNIAQPVEVSHVVVDPPDLEVVPKRKPKIPQKNFGALLKNLNSGGGP